MDEVREYTRQEMESMLRLQTALDRVADMRPRWLKVPHVHGQLQFLQSRHKIRVAIPGNGWGKSTTMAMAADMLCQKDDPFNRDMCPSWAAVGIWVTHKFQQFDILKHQLEEEVWTRPWEWNQTRHFYRWPNGSELHVVSSDSDWTQIQGISADFVCFDEHPDRKLWNEFMFRRRGKRKTRYMVAATMTLGHTWFVREVIQKWEKHHRELGLAGEEARVQQKHPSIWVWDKGGISDNPCMTDEDVSHYKEFAHASGKELKVRLEGGYADFAGESVFDTESLDRQLVNIKSGKTGSVEMIGVEDVQLIVPEGYKQEQIDLSQILKKRLAGLHSDCYVQWNPDGYFDGGSLHVWEAPSIEHTYVIGADFAAGLVGRDYDAAVVLKKREDGVCEQVAQAEGWWGDSTFAEILYLLAMWYFNAFIVGERQFGLPTLRRLYDEYRYPYIFRGRNEVTRSRRPSDLLGHHRSSGDTIIPNLRSALLHDHLIIRSESLLEQLRQYQYMAKHANTDMDTAKSNQLITSAPTGINDDALMALAYSWHGVREVGRFTMPIPEYAPGTYGHIFDNERVLRGQKPRNERRPPAFRA